MRSAMKTRSTRYLVLAILASLPLAALAQDNGDEDDVAQLIKPTNYLEFGLGYTQHESAQFGQYNGLGRSGGYLVGNLLWQGGNAYGQGTGTSRWSIAGHDLGTTSRAVEASIADQGTWALGLRYDGLRHQIADTYQTPLQGSMGGNSFSMPDGFGVVSTARPSTPMSYGTQTLTPTQQAYLHRVRVHSDRDTSGLSFAYHFDRQWDAKIDWSHVEQSGAKLMSSATDRNNTSSSFLLADYRPGAESIQMIMNPTSYTTDNVNLALDWAGAKAFFTVSGFASWFRDHNDGVSFPNPYTSTSVANGTLLAGPYPVDTLSTPPDNDYYKLGFSGGYHFSPKTQLTGGYSYGRNTQNASYINQDQMQPGGLPVGSLDGKVINTHADLKLTNRTTRDLSLSAGVIYNKRNNQTRSYAYAFYDLGSGPETSVNIPLSYSTTKGTLAANYRISSNQHLHVAYEYKRTKRWCNNALANQAQGTLSATNTGYYTVASCVQVPRNRENKYLADYRASLGESVDLTAGYSYADRKATVNSSFYNPMQANDEGFENYGYRAYFDASRKENLFKGGISWQASEHLSLTAEGRTTHDQYYDSPLGVQHGNSISADLGAAYQFSAKASISAYADYQKRSRGLLNANGRDAVAPLPDTWTNSLLDKSYAYGLMAKRVGLLGDRLDLAADLGYSRDTTRYATQLNYTNASCTAPSNGGYVCGQLPAILSKLARVRLTATYALDKRSAMAFGYIYERLRSNDYYYNFYQLGFTAANTMPTNQLAPSYHQNVFFMAYRYSFQ